MSYPAFTPDQLRIKPALAALAQLRGSSGNDAEWRRLVAQAMTRKQDASAASARDATSRGSTGWGQISRVDDAQRASSSRVDRRDSRDLDARNDVLRRDDRAAQPASRAEDRSDPSSRADARAERDVRTDAGPAVDDRNRAGDSRRDADPQVESGGDEPGAAESAQASESGAAKNKAKTAESDSGDATGIDETTATDESTDATAEGNAAGEIDPAMVQTGAAAGDAQALAAAALAAAQGGDPTVSGADAKASTGSIASSVSAPSADMPGHVLGASSGSGEESDASGTTPAAGTTSNQAKPDASSGAATAPAARSTETTPGQASSINAGASANQAAAPQPAGQSFQSTLDALATPTASANPSTGRVDAPQSPAAQTPEAKFADDNTGNIVQQVQTKLLPRGGQMQIRLDPPEMGALLVRVSVIDGRMTATFTAENEAAADLLGNNLHQLKSSLESTGVQVERMQVRTGDLQTNSSSSSKDSDSKQQQQDGASNASSWQQQHAERQRRDQVQKMWDKLAGLEDLDLVA